MNQYSGSKPAGVLENPVYVQTADAMTEPTGRCCAIAEGPLAESESILLVEDEAFVREVTCEVLRSAGYAVLTAKTADEAVLIYDKRCGEVDLLLTDVVLPGATGVVLAARLRRQNPRLKVLFVTGYAEHMGLRETRHEEWLAKPFSSGSLLRKVKQQLDRQDFRTLKEWSA